MNSSPKVFTIINEGWLEKDKRYSLELCSDQQSEGLHIYILPILRFIQGRRHGATIGGTRTI